MGARLRVRSCVRVVIVYGGSVESVYEPVHLGVAWTSPVDVEERMMLTRRGIKLVWTQARVKKKEMCVVCVCVCVCVCV